MIPLFEEYLSEPGGNARLAPTERNVETLALWAAKYITGEFPGAVVVVPGVGFSMAGGSAVDIEPGCAIGWGTYVRPPFRQQGYAREMRLAQARELLRHGFSATIGEARVTNQVGVESLRWADPGMEWVAVSYRIDLAKVLAVVGETPMEERE